MDSLGDGLREEACALTSTPPCPYAVGEAPCASRSDGRIMSVQVTGLKGDSGVGARGPARIAGESSGERDTDIARAWTSGDSVPTCARLPPMCALLASFWPCTPMPSACGAGRGP